MRTTPGVPAPLQIACASTPVLHAPNHRPPGPSQTLCAKRIQRCCVTVDHSEHQSKKGSGIPHPAPLPHPLRPRRDSSTLNASIFQGVHGEAHHRHLSQPHTIFQLRTLFTTPLQLPSSTLSHPPRRPAHDFTKARTIALSRPSNKCPSLNAQQNGQRPEHLP